MSKKERTALWIALGVLGIWLAVLTAIVAGELAEVNRNLLLLAGGEAGGWGETGTEDDLSWGEAGTGAGGSTSASPPAGTGATTSVGVAGVEVLTGSVSLTVTVRAYGAGDLLFEPPLLASDEGQVFPVTGESLEEARVAFLDLVTRGEATARLTFAGRLGPTAGLWLLFNPSQEPANVVAPPHSVPVPLATGE